MKEQADESRNTAENRNADFERMTEQQMLNYVNKTLVANPITVEDIISPLREMISGSVRMLGLSKREHKVMETNRPDTDYVLAEQTLQDLQNIRSRQSSPEINRSRQFDLVDKGIQQLSGIKANEQDVPAEKELRESEEAKNYEDYRQTMSELWNERDEQFRNEMDDLER